MKLNWNFRSLKIFEISQNYKNIQKYSQEKFHTISTVQWNNEGLVDSPQIHLNYLQVQNRIFLSRRVYLRYVFVTKKLTNILSFSQTIIVTLQIIKPKKETLLRNTEECQQIVAVSVFYFSAKSIRKAFAFSK